MRYLVTGATGFIGGKLARELVKRGHEVATVARTPEKAADLKALGVEIYKGDITDKSSLVAPMRGVDGVFHVAAWYKVGAKDTSEAENINVNGTRNVFEVMRELNIPKGVYTSTLAVNSDTRGQLVDETYRFSGTHISEYDRTKAAAHVIADEFIKQGLPLVIVMPGMVYGIGDTSSLRVTIHQIIKRTLPLIPMGTVLTWAHVDDIVEGHILAMEKGAAGETYIIAGEPQPMRDVIELIAARAGVNPPPIKASPGMMKTMSSVMSVLERFLPLPETMRSETMRVIAGSTYIGSNAKARRELGYNPRPVSAGLPDVIEHELKVLGKR